MTRLKVFLAAVGFLFVLAMFGLYNSFQSVGGAFSNCMTDPGVTQSSGQAAAYDACMLKAGFKLKEGIPAGGSREPLNYMKE